MNYTDQQIDALLAKAEEVGLIDAPGIIRTLKPDVQEKYMEGLRSGLRQVLEILPDPEEARTVYGVLCQPWWEKERGWGERPDGWTMHASQEDRKAFIASYWERMPDKVPDEYSYPNGDGFVIEVDKEIYKNVCDGTGIWGRGNRAPQPANRRDLQLGENTL